MAQSLAGMSTTRCERIIEPGWRRPYVTAIPRPMMAVQRTRTEVETSSHLATKTSIVPEARQAMHANTTPIVNFSSTSIGSRCRRLMGVSKRKGGLQTKMTPERRRTPEQILTWLSPSRSITAERKMVTRGQAKMMLRASGTSMKETQAREQMKAMEPVNPD